MPRLRITMVLENDDFQRLSFAEFTEYVDDIEIMCDVQPGELVNQLALSLALRELKRLTSEPPIVLRPRRDPFEDSDVPDGEDLEEALPEPEG